MGSQDRRGGREAPFPENNRQKSGREEKNLLAYVLLLHWRHSLTEEGGGEGRTIERRLRGQRRKEEEGAFLPSPFGGSPSCSGALVGGGALPLLVSASGVLPPPPV